MELTNEQITTLATLANALSPKAAKRKKAKKPQFALEVNGQLCQQKLANKKEAKAAAIQIKMMDPTATIHLYEYVNEIKVDIPTTGVESLRGDK